MNRISYILKFTAYITASILPVFYICCLISGIRTVDVTALPAVSAAGLVTALITVLVRWGEPKTKAGCYLVVLLHYILLCAFMIPFGMFMGWAEKDLGGAGFMALYVLGVYLLTYTFYYITDLREAERINNALRRHNAK
ncbi:MAG: DUF3021 family protein [Oscillospiraceae bacterium]|nr:DUF3021 family protein [Oscillospiraceae bacterium]